MRFFRVERYFFKYSTAVDEVSLGSCFTNSMNRNNLVLLCVVWTYSHEIVTFSMLKLYMCDIGIELPMNPESFVIFRCIVLVISPVIVLIMSRLVN